MCFYNENINNIYHIINILLLTNCLSVFDHFVGLALKGLRIFWIDFKAKSIKQKHAQTSE